MTDRVNFVVVHIVHIITGRQLSAQPQQALQLVMALNARGVRNTLICEPDSVVGIAAQAQGLDVVLAPNAAKSAVGRILQLRRIIRRLAPALVHIHHGNSSAMPGGIGAWLARVPVLLSTDYPARRNPLQRALMRILFKRILTRSRHLGNSLIEQGLLEHRHSEVRTGIDPEACQPDWPLEKFHREFGLDDSNIVIGMIADLESRRGHRDLLKAMPRIFAAYSRTRVILIGEGPISNQIEKRIEATGLEQVITLVGHRPDLGAFLGHFDLLVHLSRDDHQTLQLLEAQANGVPVVAFDDEASRELVLAGEPANMVERGNHFELASAIQRLMYQPAKRRALGKQAAQWVRNEFSVAAMANSYVAAYRDALRGSARSGSSTPETA